MRVLWVAATLAAATMGCSGDRHSAPQPSGEHAGDQPATTAPDDAAGAPVSAHGDFGPMVGKSVTVVAPTAGLFTASYAYSQTTFITTERSVSTSITGDARLELKPDGTASACFGKRAKNRSSVGKYASPDGKYHHDERQDLNLLGARGSWKLDGGVARIVFDRVRYGSCDATEPGGPPLEVTCVAIEKNERLPVRVLACQLAPWLGFDDLALDPTDSPRAGPFAMQTDPRAHSRPDPSKAWLLLGSAPGLAVRSRAFKSAPEVTFTAESGGLVEGNYRPAPR